MSKWQGIQVGITIAGGIIGYLVGGIDELLYALLTFVIIDYVTGVMCAIVEKSLSSEVGARGIFKKIMIFLMVIIANTVDTTVVGATEIGTHAIFRTATICFYMANEGLSIFENAGRLGLPVPDWLREYVVKLKEKKIGGDEDGDA